MAKFFRVILSVLLGFIVGSAVNMGLIMISGKVIAPPVGADVTTMEGLKAALPLFEAKHFVFPFLAHALGTLAGALVAGLLAPNRSPVPAYVVGGLFLLGGIANVIMLPAPAWFSAVDLLLAYLPTAWLGQTLAARLQVNRSPVAVS
jgi:hypothetical protein